MRLSHGLEVKVAHVLLLLSRKTYPYFMYNVSEIRDVIFSDSHEHLVDFRNFNLQPDLLVYACKPGVKYSK